MQFGSGMMWSGAGGAEFWILGFVILARLALGGRDRVRPESAIFATANCLEGIRVVVYWGIVMIVGMGFLVMWRLRRIEKRLRRIKNPPGGVKNVNWANCLA